MCVFPPHLSVLSRFLSVWLVTMCVWAAPAAPATNLFATQFEFSQGYSTNLDLAGQNEWIKYGTGGNGLIPRDGGQKAYIGFAPPEAPDHTLYLLQPINFAPVEQGLPLVRFSTLMSIEDSTNGEYDYFQWSVYNMESNRLFTLDFDNYYTNISYALDGGEPYVSTGVKYAPGQAYRLTIVMNFASNVWSAALDAIVLATNLPITTTGLPLTLGDIDAVWDLYRTNAPGDNFMLFDDYTITAEALEPPPPRLHLIERTGSGRTLLTLTGQTGAAFAIDASSDLIHWTPLATNRIYDSGFDYIDSNATALGHRLYRARWVPDLPN